MLIPIDVSELNFISKKVILFAPMLITCISNFDLSAGLNRALSFWSKGALRFYHFTLFRSRMTSKDVLRAETIESRATIQILIYRNVGAISVGARFASPP